jgi:hypothetical protein
MAEHIYKCQGCGKILKPKIIGTTTPDVENGPSPNDLEVYYLDFCQECEDEGWWIDPAGGVHQPGEEDPAAMYE